MNESYEDQHEHFINSAVTYMNEYHNVELSRAKELVEKYIYKIDINKPIIQRLGSEYLAIQILMAETVILHSPI